MMRTLLSRRWLVIAVVAAVLAAGVAPAGVVPVEAAPVAQNLVTIQVVGYVDVHGSDDPDCPGCDGGTPDDEDRTFAESNPLPEHEYVVRDPAGLELARATTSQISPAIQAVSIEVPEQDEYTVELVADPAPYTLCFNESATRTLTPDDFRLGRTIQPEAFHFTQNCQPSGPTATPTSTPTATLEPGAPTMTPGPTVTEGPPPTDVPDDDDDDDDDDEDRGEGGQPGFLRGLAFIDRNQDGVLGADEPGLNDVQVFLGGGGLEISTITNGAGQYSFDGLGTGDYDVFINPGPEWRITTARKYSAVHVQGGEVTQGIDFGLVRVGAPAPADGAAAPDRLVAPPPGSGIRLPDTGIADLPTPGMLGTVALVLVMLALAGVSVERWHRDR